MTDQKEHKLAYILSLNILKKLRIRLAIDRDFGGSVLVSMLIMCPV